MIRELSFDEVISWIQNWLVNHGIECVDLDGNLYLTGLIDSLTFIELIEGLESKFLSRIDFSDLACDSAISVRGLAKLIIGQRIIGEE